MTPQERDLIASLFARLQQQGGQTKDAEAEALIRQSAAQQPDAIYLLTQTVLIQDMALHEAQNRIAALEQHAAAPPNAPAQAAPSFLPPSSSASGNGDQGSSVPSAGPWGQAPAALPPSRPVWTQNIAPPAAPQSGPSHTPAYGGGYGSGPPRPREAAADSCARPPRPRRAWSAARCSSKASARCSGRITAAVSSTARRCSPASARP